MYIISRPTREKPDGEYENEQEAEEQARLISKQTQALVAVYHDDLGTPPVALALGGILYTEYQAF
jgi:hypothetical protein